MINEIYTDALLSAAAYADWSLSEEDVRDDLINVRGFTEAQVDDFFFGDNRKYEVYGTYENGYTEDANGFSATIFRNIDVNSPDYDKLTVAFRGTDNLVDWLTNFDVLSFFGEAIGLTDLVNDQSNNVSDFLENAGLVVDGVLQSDVSFVGHSLGGYLATIASYKYADTFDSATTFNGLGISILDSLLNDFESQNGEISNYYSDLLGSTEVFGLTNYHPGSKTEIFIEEGTALENHSITKLVESLSVYRVLALVDTSLDSDIGMEKIYSILEGGGSGNDESLVLETMLSQLGDLLGDNLALQENKDDVELFYQELEAYLSNNDYNLSLIDLSNESAHLIAAQAEISSSYLYALTHLNTFAIEGSTVLYDQHNLSGELDAANYSAEYLSDRALMLSAIIPTSPRN